MSCMLSIYSINTYKKYLLPAIDNSDYSIVLSARVFQLSSDFEINMEIVDGLWFVRPSKKFHFSDIHTGKSAFGTTLKDRDVLSLELPTGEHITIMVSVSENCFTVYEKFSLDGVERISIGSASENVLCYSYMDIISARHAEIVKHQKGFLIRDTSINGVFVNGKRVAGEKKLVYGDLINLFGLKIMYLGDFIAFNMETAKLNYGYGNLKKYKNIPRIEEIQEHTKTDPEEPNPVFHRSPRYLPELERGKVEIDAPPTPKELNQKPLLFTVGPSLTMAIPMLLGSGLAIFSTKLSGSSGSAFMYTGLITAVSSALIGTVWALANMKNEKKMADQEEKRRNASYGKYLTDCANKIREKYEKNTVCLQKIYPEPAVCCGYGYNSAELWNRNRNHFDFLTQRIGVGSIPFQVEVEIPKEKFTMTDDALAAKPKLIKDTWFYLHNVPIGVNLMENRLIGIVGGDRKKGCSSIVYSLIAQIAANNCYTDVKLGLIGAGVPYQIERSLEFIRWLPHVWSEEKRMRYVSDSKESAGDVLFEIAKILRRRSEESSQSSMAKTAYFPHYILFIEDISMLEGELITKYLLEGENLGVTAVLLAERDEELPNACEYIIENTPNFQGMYHVTDASEDRIPIRFDDVSADHLEKFSRKLSGIQVSETETGGEIPNTLTFFEMYGIGTLEELKVEERWRKNRTYDNIRGMVGQKAGGVPCYLDVHEKYHGPHGLVAGTTGSGKSETLQTYMLSLAVNYSPEDIGFFIIDYKGGGMANLFSGLPHIIGQISNLSGNQIHRAMVSIKSENLKRQKIFREYGVNNINHYVRLYKNKEASVPVPHMFIIIDEFAELKREEPDFMKELISVAQVGRSLGVHLILATQKPAGTVDDNIWSNSKFRLCLRVQDRQDSNDMLHRPDAAYITQAGRCYLQVGNNEIFELFQSGWSGAVYDADSRSSQTDIAKMLSVTGKAAIVGSHTRLKQKEKRKVQWIVSLLSVLEAAGIDKKQIKEAAQDSITAQTLSKRFFKEAEQRAMDYPESDYNARRIQEFFEVYAEVLLHAEDSLYEKNSLYGKNSLYEKNSLCTKDSLCEKDSSCTKDSLYAKDFIEKSEIEHDKLAEQILSAAAKQNKKLPEGKEKTQLDAIVEYLASESVRMGCVHNLKLWLPVLPTELYLEELNGYEKYAFDGKEWRQTEKQWTLEAFVGLLDDPVNQAQMLLIVDLARNGNHAILGTVVSGKSTFLLTFLYSLIMRYSPAMLNIYALDYSSKMLSALEGVAHVGGILYENDNDRVGKLFTMISGMIEERKFLLRGGNYSQYVQSQGRMEEKGVGIPAVVLAIDNYSSFRAKTNNQYDELIMTLAKEGVGYGIFLVVTAGGFSPGEIPGRLGENFRTVICLEMNDKYAYSDALRTLHLEVLPEENVKGRGLTKHGESFLEFQTALPIKAADDFSRIEKIQEIGRKINQSWNGKKARKIPEIPEKPVWKEFEELDEVAAMQREGKKLPIGYHQADASVYGIDLNKTYCYLISGKSRTGKTNLMRVMLMAAFGMEADVILIDYSGEFRTLAEEKLCQYITTDQELYHSMLELRPEFIKRNQFRKDCIAKGDTDEEMEEKLREFREIFIMIGDLGEFVHHIVKPEDPSLALEVFLCNILEHGARHRVNWFACFNQDANQSDGVRLTGLRPYELFIRERQGIHFGGNVAAQRIFGFESVKYNERSTVQKAGIGMLALEGNEAVEYVVVPLYRN